MDQADAAAMGRGVSFASIVRCHQDKELDQDMKDQQIAGPITAQPDPQRVFCGLIDRSGPEVKEAEQRSAKPQKRVDEQ